MLEVELPLLFHTDIIDLVYVCSLPLYDHTYVIELVDRQLVQHKMLLSCTIGDPLMIRCLDASSMFIPEDQLHKLNKIANNGLPIHVHYEPLPGQEK